MFGHGEVVVVGLVALRIPKTGVHRGDALSKMGAEFGERVLVVSGSTARQALGSNEMPIDAAIVGIIDSLEVDRVTYEF